MTADMCWGEGSYVFWPSTPGGNTIEQFTSSAATVTSTAQEMVDVAMSMKLAAHTLEEIAGSDDGQQGKAIDALRESVGETWELLGDAGEMYYRTASAIRTYGWALGDTGGIAEALDGAYILADQAWETYQSTDGDLYGDVTADEDDEDPNAAQDASDNKAKYDAFQDWMNAANHWDKQYEDWEDAWNAAIDAIEDAHEHGPKDGWNEWFGDFLEIAYFVLTIAAIVVGILGLIFAGPFLLIGAIIGGLIAVISIVQYARGETDLKTMLIDIACAIPIGPIGKLLGKMDLALFTKMGSGVANLVGDGVGAIFPRLGPMAGWADDAARATFRGMSPYIAGLGALDLPRFGPALEVIDTLANPLRIHISIDSFHGQREDHGPVGGWVW